MKELKSTGRIKTSKNSNNRQETPTLMTTVAGSSSCAFVPPDIDELPFIDTARTPRSPDLTFHEM